MTSVVTRLVFLGCVCTLFFTNSSFGQNISVKYGKSQIALNEYFTITLTIENDRLREYSPFPEIPGFVKRGTSSSSSTSFINGRMSSSQSIIQNYQAKEQGTFDIKPFGMNVNGQQVEVQAIRVTVGAEIKQQRQADPFSNDPFRFFNQDPQPTEFVDVQAEAFLALTTDKSEVYLGEGFTTTLAFYVSEANQAELRFYDLAKQITEIMKTIKPNSCWEENFNIDNINGEPITLNNKPYTQYKIFQAAYYPLNLDPISFQSIGLKLIKYKVAKNPSFFGRNRQEDFETFNSKPKRVTVKPLPPHPLRDRVAVGNYRMAEKLSAVELTTGQSFNYVLNILGEGNLSAISNPEIPENEEFDFYAPNVKQDITRSNGQVKGTKSFNYYGIPNEPGTYDLGEYIQWIYFNPDKEVYDTLKSRQTVMVSGESRKNEYILSNDMGSFYDGIEFEDNKLVSLNQSPLIRLFANIFILAMLAASVFFMVRK